jgi:hypothetical protein
LGSAAYRAFFHERERLGEPARDVVRREIAAEQAEVLAGLWGGMTAVYQATDSPQGVFAR